MPKAGDNFTEVLGSRLLVNWPIRLLFAGRSEGTEYVRWWPFRVVPPADSPPVQHFGVRDMRERRWPLGTFVHHLITGVPIPDLPRRLVAESVEIEDVLKRWLQYPASAPRAESERFELLDRAPYGRVVIEPAFATVGRKRNGRARARTVFVWLARDSAAAAWAELLHGADHATARPCELCETPFLRPVGYRGRWCLGCRQLNWRQRANIQKAPRGVWAQRAIEAWKAIMESSMVKTSKLQQAGK